MANFNEDFSPLFARAKEILRGSRAGSGLGWKDAWKQATSERPDLGERAAALYGKVAGPLLQAASADFSEGAADHEYGWDFGEFLDRKTAEIMEEKGLSYSDAFRKAQELYPEFAQGYARQVRGTAAFERAADHSAGAKLDELVWEKLRQNQDLSYGAAFSEVQEERPDLAREYSQEIDGNR